MRSPSPIGSGENNKLPPPESANGSPATAGFICESCSEEGRIPDVSRFLKSLSGVETKGVRPDVIGSVIIHYASKWLPELSGSEPKSVSGHLLEASSESSVAAWKRKKLFVETVVRILPPEKDSVPCNVLLKLLKLGSMVGAEKAHLAELETRVASQLEQASLKEVMIPAFSHTCGTLLDVKLMLRLVTRFAGLGEEAGRTVAATVKVAKLVDCYLAEAAVDANMTPREFEDLAGALPRHARATDDGLYRAIDTYLKAHPSTTKQERKTLCRLIDTRKLSSEASIHAAQNERLPVRAVIQVLLSENSKLSRLNEWSGSFSGPRSPNPTVEVPGRCPSKREVVAQQQEIRKLRDDVMRLQIQCHSLQAQMDRLAEKKTKKLGVFNWKSLLFPHQSMVEKMSEVEEGVAYRTPVDRKKARLVQGKTTPPNWRISLS